MNKKWKIIVATIVTTFALAGCELLEVVEMMGDQLGISLPLKSSPPVDFDGLKLYAPRNGLRRN